MLILLPPSETKAPVRRGKPLDPSGLSFPTLAPTRAAVLDALIEVSAKPDATKRLGVSAGLSDVVRRNVALRDAPTAAAESVYAGVLYDALGLADLDTASRRRARAWIVVISALWGAVRLGDRIPPYRLNMCGRLPGVDAPHRCLAGTARRRAARGGPSGRRGRLPVRRVRHCMAARRVARRADRCRQGVP